MKRISAIIFLSIIISVFSISASAETVTQMPYTVILPDVTRQGLYTGDIINGMPDGYGVFVAQNSSGVFWHYLGEWKDGQIEGNGGQYWDNGKVVIGVFSNNVLSSEINQRPTTTTAASEQNIGIGHKNALRSANNYLQFMAFSYQGLIEQLEYEGYSTAEATYAADNCGADWYEQAAKKAKSYLNFMGFSKKRLVEQLEYDGFTHEQAVYGTEQNGYE